MKKTIGLLLVLAFASNVLAGDAAKGQSKAAVCAACHGADGNGVKIPGTPANPKLAGQGEKYLIKQLMEFKSGKRENATMMPMASMLSDEDMADVAAFYASQKIQHSAVPDEYITLGQRLYRAGDSDRDIPACMACHGPAGNGMSLAGYPSLGGQDPEYTIGQLKAFRSGQRDNDANSTMRQVVAKMSDEQIEALAYYLVGLH